MKYQVGDRISHPLHGGGVISGIERNRVGGQYRNYYIMHVPRGDMRVMIPVDSCEQIGIRPVIGKEQADAVFEAIPDLEVREDRNWNKRYRENMVYIRSGDLMQVAGVIKSLSRREAAAGLSNGERKMLLSAKQILLSEIMLSKEQSYEEVEERLNAALQAG